MTKLIEKEDVYVLKESIEACYKHTDGFTNIDTNIMWESLKTCTYNELRNSVWNWIRTKDTQPTMQDILQGLNEWI